MNSFTLKQNNKIERLKNNWTISLIMMTLAFSPFWMLIII